MSISPGPVNMLIVSSGVNFGVRQTMAMVLGATIGFTLLLISVGFGLIHLVSAIPYFLKYLTLAGSVFIIYMGYKIATTTSKPTMEQTFTKLGFIDGFLLQWLNPKAWVACVSGVSLFASVESSWPLVIFISCYFVICFLSLTLWAILGGKMALMLNNAVRLKIFNLVMGGLLMSIAAYLSYRQLWLAEPLILIGG